MIAGLAVALMVACDEPAKREPTSEARPVPGRSAQPPDSGHVDEAAYDPQSLVGISWNTIRPSECQGETLLRSTEPLRSYVLASWRGRTLFVYREGGPSLEILGVLDLGAFDWKTRIVSGAVFDYVTCWDPQDGERSEPGLIIGVVEVKNITGEVFRPERAWEWNPHQARFEAVEDPSRVSCVFDEQGDTPLEDWRKSWPTFGWPNYQCEIATSSPPVSAAPMESSCFGRSHPKWPSTKRRITFRI